jgi:hypothetical protein
MIEVIDDALKKLLIRELPIKKNEVDIAFDQPKREWSAKISRPTLNLYIYDIHENNKLRMSKQWAATRNPDGTASERRPPLRLDLHYMISAWATDPQDEHRLLARSLAALLRTSQIPLDLLPDSLKQHDRPVQIEVAQPDLMRNATDVWSVLDNEMRPAIPCTITMPLDPFEPQVGPIVISREIRTGITTELEEHITDESRNQFWMVGGMVRSIEPLGEAVLRVRGHGVDLPVGADGEFVIGKLHAGDYTLELRVKNRKKPHLHKITVPSGNYDLEI